VSPKQGLYKEMKAWIRTYGVYLISVLVIFLWGMSYVWTKQLLEIGIPVEFFLPIRIFLAGVLLLMYNLAVGHPVRIHCRKDFLLFLLLSLCEPLVYFFAETYGLALTGSATVTALIIAMNPVIALFFGVIFFKEKMSLVNIFGLLITLTGLVFVLMCHRDNATEDAIGHYYYLGIGVLLVAVLAEVSHASLTKRLATGSTESLQPEESARKGYDPSVIVMYQFLIGSIYMLPLLLTRGLHDFSFAVYFSWDVLYPLIALSFLCSCVAFSLWAISIKQLGVAKSGNFIAMTPIATAICAWLIDNEHLLASQWIGIAVAMVGLILTQHAGGVNLHRLSLRRLFLR